MRRRVLTILATALLCLVPTASWADLAPYSQDFEGLTPAPQDLPATSLGDDGWRVFANVFDAYWNYLYGYGPFPAPNHGQAFSAVIGGEGGPMQGAQQLSVFSDYNNGGHGLGQYIESNIFQEQTVGAGDVGTTWLFRFDAKRGNIGGVTTARAFFKTINPATGYSLTNFLWIDMTNVPANWESYALSIYIDPSLVGQLLQFGFLNTATGYQGSGVFYDNVSFTQRVSLDLKPGSCPNPICSRSRGVQPVAVLGTGNFDVTTIDVSSLRLEGVAPIRYGYEDVSAPYAGDLCGCNGSGPDGFPDLTLKFSTQEIMDAIGRSPSGDRVLTLTGTLLDGTPIAGQDCAVILSCGEPPRFRIGPVLLNEQPLPTVDSELSR